MYGVQVFLSSAQNENLLVVTGRRFDFAWTGDGLASYSNRRAPARAGSDRHCRDKPHRCPTSSQASPRDTPVEQCNLLGGKQIPTPLRPYPEKDASTRHKASAQSGKPDLNPMNYAAKCYLKARCLKFCGRESAAWRGRAAPGDARAVAGAAPLP